MPRQAPKRKIRGRRLELAKPGDPLVHSDGEIYQPDICPEAELSNLPAPVTMNTSEFTASTRRSMAELPASTSTMSGIGAILVYTILGITNREIAEALQVDPLDIEEVKHSTAYRETFDAIMSELIGANSMLLQGRIAAHTHIALNKVIHLATAAKREETALKASTDILDRAGARPQDNVLRSRGGEGNELRIVITRADETKDLAVQINGETV